MGACYSKSGATASLTPPEKAPKTRRRLSWRSKRRDRDDSSVSKELGSQVGFSESPARDLASELTPVEADPLLVENLNGETGDKDEDSPLQARVAPSDSGIESIGTTQEECQDQRGAHQGEETVELKLRKRENGATARANEEDSDSSSGDETSAYLSRQLQRLSRGSCHKCGNFKLDDSAINALLADSYCICGPRRAGRPSVNPQCQTHGLRQQRSTISYQEDSGAMDGDDGIRDGLGSVETSKVPVDNDLRESNRVIVETVPRKSSLKKGMSSEVLGGGRSLRVSLKSLDETAKLSASNCKNNFDDVFEDEIHDERDSSKTVWTHYSSLEKSLENFSLPTHQRRSLLSEILDITDSICRCDFYSNEIYCSPEEQQELDDSISKSVQCVTQAASAQQIFSDEDLSKSSPALYSPLMKKCLSSSKNVSFAKDNESKSFSTSDTFRPTTSFSKDRGSIQSSSSGVLKGNLQRLSSLGSSEGIVESGSSSEEDLTDVVQPPEENDTVTGSNTCRKTLSYSSDQQSVGTTNDLAAVYSARRMFIDGCDSIVIPTEVFLQLEADLNMMKERLLCLSSLMLEEPEDPSRYETEEPSWYETEEPSWYETEEPEESFA